MSNIQKTSPTRGPLLDSRQAESGPVAGKAPELAQRNAKQLAPTPDGEHVAQAGKAPLLGNRGRDEGLLHLERLLAGLPLKLDGK